MGGHLLLEKGLLSKPEVVGGRAFCISNEEPIVLEDFYASLVFFYEQITGRRMPLIYLPKVLMYTIAWLNEKFQWLTRTRVTGDLAMLTPAMFNLATLSYSFSSRTAADVLGYA